MTKKTDPRVGNTPSNANEAIQDRVIRHMVFLERLKTQQVRKVQTVLNKQVLPGVIRRIERRLNAVGGPLTTAGLKKLEKALAKISDGISKQLKKTLGEDLTELSRDEISWMVGMIREELDFDLEFDLPSPATVAATAIATPFSGFTLDQWFETLSRSTQRKLTQTIQQGMIEGRTIPQIMRDIRGTRALNYTDGVLQTTRREAETITRSAVQHVANQARLDLFKENEDIIKGLKYTATLDSRTSIQCAGLDGRVFPLDKGPRPPIHPNCRSTMTPVLKSARSLGLKNVPEGTRASINGQVPANTTYGEWLKRQPVAVQEQVLGKTKAALFRKGNLPISRFTSTGLDPLTVEELRLVEKSAFKRAGVEL